MNRPTCCLYSEPTQPQRRAAALFMMSWRGEDTGGWKQTLYFKTTQNVKPFIPERALCSHIPSRPVSKASKHKGRDRDGAERTKGPWAASPFTQESIKPPGSHSKEKNKQMSPPTLHLSPYFVPIAYYLHNHTRATAMFCFICASLQLKLKRAVNKTASVRSICLFKGIFIQLLQYIFVLHTDEL